MYIASILKRIYWISKGYVRSIRPSNKGATHEPEEKLPKILIVEDDERLARLTQEYLIRNGLEVGVEPDGNRAIRRIIAEQPDMVVLDVMLPGADGLTICREVRPHYHQPILMLTARTEDMDQVLGLEMGCRRLCR